VDEGEFVFFARQTTDLHDSNRRFALSADDLKLINPNTQTAPVFRSRRDAEITKAIYRRVPVLVREGDVDDNPWGIEYQTMFHMTNDSHLFRTASELQADGAMLVGNLWSRDAQRWLPLYEGKMIFHFDHRYGTYEGQTLAQANQGTLPTPTHAEHEDPQFVVQARYWVDIASVRDQWKAATKWTIAFRDISNAGSERTMIATIVPEVACNEKLPLIRGFPSDALPLLMATLNSFCHDYVVRQKVGGNNINFFRLKQFPVLPPSVFQQKCAWSSGTVKDWLHPRVIELLFTSWDLHNLVSDLGFGYGPFRWDPGRRELLRAELDAAFFLLYETERPDVDYIMDTFPIVKRKDEAAHGDFRTKRLILERYDALAAATAAGTEYQTVLDPPPADPRCAHLASTRPPWA
jgi:hypothetical protein